MSIYDRVMHELQLEEFFLNALYKNGYTQIEQA